MSYPQYIIIESDGIEAFNTALANQQALGFQPYKNIFVYVNKDGNSRYVQQLVKNLASVPTPQDIGMTKQKAFSLVQTGRYKIRHNTFEEGVFLRMVEDLLYLGESRETVGGEKDPYWIGLSGPTYATGWSAALLNT